MKDAFKATLRGSWINNRSELGSPEQPGSKPRASRKAWVDIPPTPSEVQAAIEESARRLKRRHAELMQIERPSNETIRRLDAVVAVLLREVPLADLLRAVRETEGDKPS